MKQTIIQTTEAADLLTKPESRRLLAPFIKDEVTLSGAAEKFGIKLNALHYHVQKWLELDLVEVVREETQNGRRVKRYRATSETFIVPLEATSSVSLESHCSDLLAKGGADFGKWFALAMRGQSDSWAFRIGADDTHGVVQSILGQDEQGVYQTPVDLPRAGIYYASDLGLRLNDETAEALQRELETLYNKYYRLESTRGNYYWFQVGLAPIPQQ